MQPRLFFVNVYELNLHVKALLWQKSHFSDLSYCFWAKIIFNGSAMGTFTIASKLLFLKVPYDEKLVFSGLYIYKLVLAEPANSQNEESAIPAWSRQPTHW